MRVCAWISELLFGVCCARINVTFFFSFFLDLHSPWDSRWEKREKKRGERDKVVGGITRGGGRAKKITSCQALPRICYTEMHVYSQLQQPEEEDARPHTKQPIAAKSHSTSSSGHSSLFSSFLRIIITSIQLAITPIFHFRRASNAKLFTRPPIF